MKTLILGGVKSGKSRHAEELATGSALPVTIIATALPIDKEMSKRIAQHKADRPKAWSLVEEPIELGSAIEAHCKVGHCVLVDCLTLWLTQLLVREDELLFTQETQALISAVKNAKGTLIVVSNENNMGVVPLGELSRRYCDEVGLLHQHIAATCDQVMLTVAGLPLMLKSAISTE